MTPIPKLATTSYDASLRVSGGANLFAVKSGIDSIDALEAAHLLLTQALSVLYSFEPDELCMDRMGAAINQVVLAQAVICSVVSGSAKGGKP